MRRTGENHLFVSGRLDGRRRSFLVDTGWSFTTVSTNAARLLKKIPAGSAADGVTLGNITLGDKSFTNQPALVQHIVFNGQPASFDVVLGLDFLRRNFAVLDCARQRLYLRREAPTVEAQKDFENGLRRGGFVELELRLKEPPAITAIAQLNGQTLEMLVDSGAAWSCVDARQRERLGLKALPSLVRISGAGRTGSRNVAVANVNSFRLGEVEMKRTTLAMLDLADWGFAAPEKTLSEVRGILGGEILAAGGAVIDCHALKLWVKRDATARRN